MQRGFTDGGEYLDLLAAGDGCVVLQHRLVLAVEQVAVLVLEVVLQDVPVRGIVDVESQSKSAARSGNGVPRSASAPWGGRGSIRRQCSLWSTAGTLKRAMNSSERGAGIPVDPSTLIQNPSVSTRAPRSASMVTRLLHQRADNAEHHERRRTSSSKCAGPMTRMMHRRSTQKACS